MNIKKPTDDSQPSNLHWIELSDFEALCFSLARELYTFNQPIPDFSTRNPGVLESCLESPLQEFNGKELYPTFEKKLAILFYLLIKNHPFQNGNKRLAMTSLFTVLYFNGKWISVEPVKIYRLAREVSASDRRGKDYVLHKIERFIKDYIVGF